MLILRLCLSIISLFLIGYPLIYYLLLRKSPHHLYRGISGRIYIFFVSFYSGILLMAIYLMVLSIAGIAFSFLAVVVFASVFFVFSVYLIVKQEGTNRRSASTNKDVFQETDSLENSSRIRLFSNRKFINAVYAFIIFLISVNFIVVVFFTFLFPIRFWDAISCWSLKGRAFFIDSSIFPFFTEHSYGFAHLSYPLYIPLLQTWIYLWIGVIDETLVKVIFPIFYLSLVFLFYHTFRQKFNKIFSIIIVFILSALPIVMDHGYMEYTNLVFSIILFLGVYYFYIYISSDLKKSNLLVLSALFFTILTQVRTEGLVFLAVFLLVNTVVAVIKIFKIGKKRSLNIALSIISPPCLAFFLILPWLYIKKNLGISTFSSEWTTILVEIQEYGQGILEFFNLPAALRAISAGLFYSAFDSARAFLGASYGIVWFVMIIILIINFKRSVRDYKWIFPVFILTGLTSLLLSFAMIEEFIWSTDRYLLHMLPLTYFWIFYNLPLFKKRKNS